jgi:hypothetical protein
MLSSYEEAVAARAPYPSAVDLRSVPQGTELVVETSNSRYRFVILDDNWNVLVQGGRFFEHDTRARVDRCTLGGFVLKLGWIARGSRLEMSVRGQRIVTSRVRSISVSTAA